MEGPLTGPSRHRARVVWEGDKRDLRAHRVEIAEQVLPGSCSEHWGGDPDRADPEQLFVAALSSCHMLWFLALARERRLRVRLYEDHPVGTLEDGRMTMVRLTPQVGFESEPDDAVVAELHELAHERCFLANSVSCPVEVEPA
jgi:organic hydroperoxide reductase OsmC/OhrA